MGKPSAPKPPDPQATATAQEQVNTKTALQNAELNRVNQTTPLGSSTWSITGTYPDGTPIYAQNISLSPTQQKIYDSSTQGAINQGNIALGMQNQVGGSYARPIDTSNVSKITGQVPGQQDQGAAIKQAQDAAYRGQTQYLDPQFQQQEEALRSNLANQGIAQGSEAWNTAMGNFARQKQAAYQSAQNAAVGAGNQEQSVLFGQGLSQANLQNAASQEGMSQLFALRNQPLNEYNALMSGAQVHEPNFPGVPGVNVQPTDVAGIINQGYQNQLGYYNAQMAPWNSLFSLGGSLGAAAIMSPTGI